MHVPSDRLADLLRLCCGHWVPLVAAAPLLLSCNGEVVVGQAKPDQDQNLASEQDASSEQETPKQDAAPDQNVVSEQDAAPLQDSEVPVDEPEAAPEDPARVDCTDEDALAREAHDAWLATPNDLGVLAGKTFSGYVEGGPDLVLTVLEDQTATLVVGEPAAPPKKDKGYLCGENVQFEINPCNPDLYSPTLIVGGTYPLHGAALSDSRFTVGLQKLSPWDPWCALQTPVLQEDCYFTPLRNDTVGGGPNVCFVGTESVDCGWLDLVFNGVCSCTSTECFAAASDLGLLDARLDETGSELMGSYLGSTVYLFEQ